MIVMIESHLAIICYYLKMRFKKVSKHAVIKDCITLSFRPRSRIPISFIPKIILTLLTIFILILSPYSFGTRFESNIPEIGQSGDFVIDTKQEKTIGSMMMQKLHSVDAVHPDAIVNDYLSGIARKLQTASGHSEHKLHFFCVTSDELNAVTFFGGHVAVFRGIILTAENESELAAVLSHETAHIAQHHLARLVTNNKKMMPLTIAELIAALAIGVGSPEAGMHMATAALGGHVQNIINFTHTHEKEADRIGMQILAKAGYNPQAMPAIFQRMQTKSLYQSKPPEYLLTHPMYEDRVADSSNRAEKLPSPKNEDNLYFHLIRARLVAGNEENAKRRVQRLTTLLKKETRPEKAPLEYALALSMAKNRQYAEATEIMQSLKERHPNQWLFQFGLAEIAREKGDLKETLAILKSLYEEHPNYAIIINYAGVLLDNKEIENARQILIKYQKTFANEPQLLELLARAQGLTGHKIDLHQTLAEWHFLRGEYKETYQQLELASEYASKKPQRLAQIAERKKNIQEIAKEQKKLQ